jgi:hypothetical protein
LLKDCGGIFKNGEAMRTTRHYRTKKHQAELDRLEKLGQNDSDADIAEFEKKADCDRRNVDADGDDRNQAKPKAKSPKTKTKPENNRDQAKPKAKSPKTKTQPKNNEDEDSKPSITIQMMLDQGAILEDGKAMRMRRRYMTETHRLEIKEQKAIGEHDSDAEFEKKGYCDVSNLDADGEDRDHPKQIKPRATKKRKRTSKKEHNNSPMKKIAAKGKKKQDKKKPTKDDKDE